MPSYKPVGVDGENSLFPTRVMDALKRIFLQSDDVSDSYTPLPKNLRNPLTGWYHADGFNSIQAALDVAAADGGGRVYVQTSTSINSSLNLPATIPVGISCAEGVTITATAAMPAMITKPAGACDGIVLLNVNLNGSMLAARGVDIEQAHLLHIVRGVWQNFTYAGADFGKSGGQVYEMEWTGTRVVGISDVFPGATPAQMPSYGYRLGANATDNNIVDVVVKNAKILVADQAAGNSHVNVHVFGYPFPNGTVTADYTASKGFYLTGSNTRLIAPYCDTQTLGIDCAAPSTVITAAQFFWDPTYTHTGNLIGVNVSASNCTISSVGMRLPKTGSLTGYPFQIQAGVTNTIINGANIYGTGWLAFINNLASSIPVIIGNTWDSGAIPYNFDLGGGSVLAGTNSGITGAAATNRDFAWFTGANRRAALRLSNANEAGNSQGSPLDLITYKDDGTFGFNIFEVQRHIGVTFFQRAVNFVRSSQTLATTGAVTIDAAASNKHLINLQANATSTTITNASSLASTTPQVGQEVEITFAQDVTGGRTYSWPANCRFAGNVAPTDTTASRQTTVRFRYESSAVWIELSRAVSVPNG